MAGSGGEVRILGLTELRKGFSQVDGHINSELRRTFVQLADHVAERAQQKMPLISGTAIRSMKPRATRDGAGIAVPRGGPGSGKTSDGYYPWLEYGGGKVGARGITASSPIAHAKATGGFKRPHKPGGRYLYPAIAESREEVADAAYEAVMRAAHDAGFGTE